MTELLFDTPIDLPDGQIEYYPEFFDSALSDHYLKVLSQEINWATRTLQIYGKKIPMPRLIAWYANPGVNYEYSKGVSPHNDWIEPLLDIKSRIENFHNTHYNGVLLNLYRNGNDSMGWHSDNEACLSEQPVIASLSFGATRRFELKHRFNSQQKKRSLPLEHGSLLIMKGQTQQFWQHCVPKDRHIQQARINLTFRHILQ